MWIVGAVTMVTVLAPGLGSGAVEPAGDARGLDRSASHVQAQQVQEPRIWLDRGVDPVLEAGDRVRIYYRTNADAYVAILQIDTDGTTRMLYPRSPTESHYARADRDYRLLFPRSAYWNVDDRPGMGYFFVVTSPTPFDLSDFRYSYYDGGWDLSAVGVRCTRIPTSPWTIMLPAWSPIGKAWTTDWISFPTVWEAPTSSPGSCAISATGSARTARGIHTGTHVWISGWSCTMTRISIPHTGTVRIVL